MRQFAIDSPEFFVFKIEGAKKTYKIPLASSLTNKQAVEFEKTGGEYRAQIEWLRGFIGDVVDDLTPAVTSQILQAWSKESRDQGASVGES